MLVLLTVLTAASGALVSSTEVGQVALLDQWERAAWAFGQPIDDARYAELQAWSHRGPAVSVASAVLGGPGLAAVVSLIAFVWLRRRASVSYSQVLAVVVHAGVILALGRLVAAPLVYARETTASATTMGVWFSSLDESSPVARFLGAIDLFTVWWVVVLGIGLAVLSGHPARTSIGWVVSIYVGMALAATAVMAVAS